MKTRAIREYADMMGLHSLREYSEEAVMAQTFVDPSEIYGWFRGWHNRRQEYREIFISNVIEECEEERNRIIYRMSLFSWMLRIIQNFFFGKSFLQDKHLFINSVKSWPRRRDAKKAPPNIRRSLMHVFFKVYLLYTRMSLKSRKFDEVRVATLQSWPANW